MLCVTAACGEAHFTDFIFLTGGIPSLLPGASVPQSSGFSLEGFQAWKPESVTLPFSLLLFGLAFDQPWLWPGDRWHRSVPFPTTGTGSEAGGAHGIPPAR